MSRFFLQSFHTKWWNNYFGSIVKLLFCFINQVVIFLNFLSYILATNLVGCGDVVETWTVMIFFIIFISIFTPWFEHYCPFHKCFQHFILFLFSLLHYLMLTFAMCSQLFLINVQFNFVDIPLFYYLYFLSLVLF